MSGQSISNISGHQCPELASGEMTALVSQMFEAFETVCLIVKRQSAEVIWTSPGAINLLPRLTDTEDKVTLTELYPELWRLFQDVSSNEEWNSNSSVSVVIENKPYQCQQAIISEDCFALKMSIGSDTFAQLSKYMADREELFNTSRTITVSEMATTLAHEINQPVGAISNILKGLKVRLKRTETIPAEYVTAIDRALEQTSFAARIVSRIRDFTMARQPKRINCEVQQLLRDSVQLLDWVLMNADVQVEFSFPEKELWVNADATMLQQVFTNLIRNAVEATRELSSDIRLLKLRVSRQADDVQIEISDNGHGLTDATQDKFYVPFVTQKTQGMGVGLNICRSFVELHQGKLWLMPNDEGGCTASVLLPVLEPQVSPSEK